MKILVCGGRDYAKSPGHDAPEDELERFKVERDHIYSSLYDICDEFGLWLPPDDYGNTLPTCTIISGKAKGADQTAIDWAVVNWTDLEEYPADWEAYGRSAGYIRNKQMLVEGKPDLVLAFPGGKGTQNMIDIAEKAGVEVRKFERPNSEPQQSLPLDV